MTTVRPATPADRAAIDAIFDASWGGPYAVGHGVRYDLRALPTIVAENPGWRPPRPPAALGPTVGAPGPEGLAGVLTYHLEGDAIEVVSIDASPPRSGVGTALLTAAAQIGRNLGARRLWLVTTNDNLDALRFYQRRGLRITAVHPGAVDGSRRLKPQIPEIGAYGIPIRDELILELPLT
jgi:GNAT superfamily N-acetyltransferase